MKKDFLLPNSFRLIGWIVLPFAIAFLVAAYTWDFSIAFLKTNIVIHEGPGMTEKIDFTGTTAIISVFLCLFFIAFTREKHEDEYVQQVRLRALQISVYANYVILGISTLFIYGLNFLMVMECNLFTILILFIIIYYYRLHIKPRLIKQNAA